MTELAGVARECGIALVGGHTEITDAVTRPVVTGMVVGTVSSARFIDKKNMKTGDLLLFTKSVALEGTAIIAREFPDRLTESGMTQEEIQKCRNLISGISILKEAAIASGFKGVHAMHDVTEGGAATAAAELSAAGGHRLRIEVDKIPVFPETEKICRVLGLDPLGLIGSGSLLIACSPVDFEKLIKGMAEAGVPVACIGEVLETGLGVEAISDGTRVAWPCFERDELIRLYK
jgi:hydrogenase maturation factor